MNKPIMTIFALLVSIASVAEEPGKEDTILWLYQKIGTIVIPEYNSTFGGKYEYRKVSREYYIIEFPEDGTKIQVSRESRVVHKDFDGDTSHYSYGYILSAELSDLSSQIEFGTSDELPEDYISMVLSCASKACLEGIGRDYDGDSYNISWNEVTIIIPRTIADRVQKALSHLIILSGGKKEVSEDLF